MQNRLLKNVISGKLTKMFLSIVLTFALLFGMFAGLPATTTSAQTGSTGINKAVYVALGDSVPAGYALSKSDDCYVNLFSDEMTENGYDNSMFNYAISGTTTKDLLSSLQNMQSKDPQALKEINNANIITVNIGGNNVLGPLIAVINEQLEQQFKDLGITDIKNATQLQLLSLGLYLPTMQLDSAQLAKIEKGVQSFSEDFPQIIKWLKTNAPGANLIVSTIYNPIPNIIGFYSTSDTLLNQMNTIITQGSKQNGYNVADVYSAFVKEQAKGTQILNLNFGQYANAPISIDIHPNAAGHKLIASLHKDIFNTIPNLLNTDSKSPVTSMISLGGTVDKNGLLKANISKKVLSCAIDKAQIEAKRQGKGANGIAVIFNHANSDIKSINVTIEDTALDLLKSKGVKEVTISTGILKLGLDKEAIKKIQLKAKGNLTATASSTVKLSKSAKQLIGSRPVYKITAKDAKGNTISDLGKGRIHLSLRYTASANEKAGNLHGVYINSKGQPKLLTGSNYADGWVSFTAASFSSYGIGYKK